MGSMVWNMRVKSPEFKSVWGGKTITHSWRAFNNGLIGSIVIIAFPRAFQWTWIERSILFITWTKKDSLESEHNNVGLKKKISKLPIAADTIYFYLFFIFNLVWKKKKERRKKKERKKKRKTCSFSLATLSRRKSFKESIKMMFVSLFSWTNSSNMKVDIRWIIIQREFTVTPPTLSKEFETKKFNKSLISFLNFFFFFFDE